MNKLTLKAEKRSLVGRKVKKLRKEGILPANLYGRNVKSVALQVENKEFQKVFEEAGETGLVELKLDKKSIPVLIHNVQIDPVSDKPIHADFLQVDLKKKVVAKVPVELIGESPAQKQGLGTVVLYVDEVEVEALPGNLPEKFEIDASKLTSVDQVFTVGDLEFDSSKVEIKAALDQILVKVEPPKAVEEVPTEEIKEEEEKAEEAAESKKEEEGVEIPNEPQQ